MMNRLGPSKLAVAEENICVNQSYDHLDIIRQIGELLGTIPEEFYMIIFGNERQNGSRKPCTMAKRSRAFILL